MTGSLKFPKYFSWSFLVENVTEVSCQTAKWCCRPTSKHALHEQICTECPHVCAGDVRMCVWGVLPAWSPLQNVHQSVTNKSAESVLEIAPSLPGLRSHLSPLGQGFGTFATQSLHSNMLQKGILCTWGRLLWYAGGWAAAQVELYFYASHPSPLGGVFECVHCPKMTGKALNISLGKCAFHL